ncbi:MAG: TRAP transporter small permease [Candidatus Eiseniibacteriota bacterium]
MADDQGTNPDAGAPSGSPIVRWTIRLLDWAAGIVLFAMMAMTCVDVVGRYFFNSPLSITTDYTRLAMALIVFTVFPAICWFEEHICVDILDSVFPKRFVNLRQLLINLLAAVGLGFVAARVWFIAERAARKGDMTEFSLVPVAPFYYYISILLAVTALALLLNAARYARGRGLMSPPPIGSV